MIVSERDRLLFLAVGKTGSTSVWRYLKSRHDAKIVGGYHGNDVPQRYRDFFTFAGVRNPYSRMVSLYRYVRGKRRNRMHPVAARMKFPQFVRWHCDVGQKPRIERVQTMSEFLRGIRIDALLRQETLQEDFERLPFVQPPLSLGRARAAKDAEGERVQPTSWMRLYDYDTACVVEQWASEDFDMYGYDRNSWR